MAGENGVPSVDILYLRDALSLYGASGLGYATDGSAGLDLRAVLADDQGEVAIPAGGRFLVPTGVAVAPQAEGLAGFIYSRSGLGARDGLTVAQGVGVVDPDYRGEIFVMLLNTSGSARTVKRGDRIAQLVFQPIVRVGLRAVSQLDATARGAGGFGHTGTK